MKKFIIVERDDDRRPAQPYKAISALELAYRMGKGPVLLRAVPDPDEVAAEVEVQSYYGEEWVVQEFIIERTGWIAPSAGARPMPSAKQVRIETRASLEDFINILATFAASPDEPPTDSNDDDEEKQS